VVCFGGKWEIDRIAAEMLAHALGLEGIHAEARSATALDMRHLPRLSLSGDEIVCLSYFRQDPLMPARHLARRGRSRWPAQRVGVAAGGAPPEMLDEEARRRVGPQDVVAGRGGRRIGSWLSSGGGRAGGGGPLHGRRTLRARAMGESASATRRCARRWT